MRFIAFPSYTPHRIAFGLTPSALRLAFHSGSQTLKGGVNFKSVHTTKIAPQDFFNNPASGVMR